MKFIGSIGIALLVLTFPLAAQTAKVIALSPADAAEAKDLYAQRDAILKKIDDLHQKIADKYLSDVKPGPGGLFSGGYIVSGCALTLQANGNVQPCPPPTAAEKKAEEDRKAKEKLQHHLERKYGWSSFEFSEDFKFVVPVVLKYTTNPYWTDGNRIIAN